MFNLRLAVIFDRFGPYHLARLDAAGQRGEVHGIEVVRQDATYGWAVDQALAAHCVRTTLFDHHRQATAASVGRAMWRALEHLRPDVVAVPGWSKPACWTALSWATTRGRPVILMSDSQRIDKPRRALGEWVKRQFVGGCAGALVAGERHRNYVFELGMPWRRIRLGYDVVDNAHFAQGAEAARAQVEATRAASGVPRDYFFVSARFVPKKNLPMLLDAFVAYLRELGDAAWHLVVAGDGPLEAELVDRVREHQLAGRVHFVGFRSYQELPALYGLARALVLPSVEEQWGLVVNEALAAGTPVLVSERCGCVPELVVEGKTGWTFDPTSPPQLAEHMARLTREPALATQMGEAGQQRVAAWTPERFAEALWDLAEQVADAGLNPRPQPSNSGC